MRPEFMAKLEALENEPKTLSDKLAATLGERLIIELATAVAAGYAPESVVFEQAGVDPRLWEHIRASRLYQLHLEEQLYLANTPRAVDRRIRDRARAMVEAALPDVYALATSGESPMARLEAFRTLAKLAGADAKESKGPDRPKASITIDLG